MQGGITHHYIASNLNYCNRINNVGTIQNTYNALLIGNKFKLGVLFGKDSACGNISGPIASLNLSENIDFIAGFYNTNTKVFAKRGIIPPSAGGVTPVAGYNFKFPLYTSDKYSIKLNNIVSFGIITHAISLDF